MNGAAMTSGTLRESVARLVRRPPVLASAILLAVFLLLFAYAYRNPLTPDTPRVLDPHRIKTTAEEEVRFEIRDGDSARFRDEFVSGIRPILVVCGEVNHRNDTGGYTGFRRFIGGSEFVALESEVGPEIMSELWSAMCRRER
jgi:hypothetical protein